MRREGEGGGRERHKRGGGEGGDQVTAPPSPPVSHQCQAETDRHTMQPGLNTIQMPVVYSLKLICIRFSYKVTRQNVDISLISQTLKNSGL
jgi:hypothetical protein